jgi:hypothetical protein
MTRGRKLAIMLFLLFVAAQLIPISRTNPLVTGEIEVPAEVGSLLERSCYDCHSNETEWPWYSRVAPASWLVAWDVSKARDELNFSQWADYDERRRAHKLEELEEHVEEAEMPLPRYLWLHADARLSDAERGILIEWARSLRGDTPAAEHEH